MRTLPDGYYEKEEKKKKPRKKAVKAEPPIGKWLPAPRINRCPVPKKTLIDIRFGDGHVVEEHEAGGWGWGYADEDANNSGAIIEFRIRWDK